MASRTLPRDALFGCLPDWPKLSNPETPNRVEPDASFVRKVHTSGDLDMPDGRRIRFWGFEDETSERVLPSPPIRVNQGQVVHVTLESSSHVHTIHHHGIEPDAHNDGAGHTSFEVGSRYTYQWRASQAGTFFYHCHVNTVLHVQMGMYGPLIVDPPGGPGTAFAGGPAYDVEALWAPISIDPAWHELSHNAGLCGDDVGLNDLNPEYFLINGAAHPDTLDAEGVAVRAEAGQTILLRLINAGYFPQRVSFGGLEATVIAADGHPLLTRDKKEFTSFEATEIRFTPGERYDVLLRPDRPGTYTASVEFFHWIEHFGRKVGEAQTTITVD